ncbi:MAG: AraC-like DNA-binding protein [Flavobacteriaceae bacterium]|jgi:AraC-like DNA-binding protein|uniref:helix-turn-helix domain-containing protein n=1 Tax=Candidatus Marifrigoribacter sp. Uisw_064 TaxID=3230970 RepID=UPI003AEDE291
MIRNLFIFLVLIFTQLNTSAQNINDELSSSNTYEALLVLFNKYKSDSINAKQIATHYIDKAKTEKDSIRIAKGYSYLSQISKASEALIYLDSTISITKNSQHLNFPGEGYLQKSNYLFNRGGFKESLKNAILAYHSAENKKNIDQQISALHQINKINELWGDYREALDAEFLAYNLLQENLSDALFSEHYLYALEGIGKSYVRLKKSDSALIYFKKGINESLKRKDSSSYYAFVSRTGMALYVKEQYKAALDSLKKGDINREMYNNSYLPFYYFYVGASYYGQSKKEKGVSYFNKIDSIYESNNTLHPELPLLYDQLVNYYQEQGNKEKQLEYLYKLVAIERVIGNKINSIKDETENEYVIPILLKDKEDLIEDLNKENKESKLLSWGIFSLFIISLFILIYYIKRQQKFRKRFELLISNQKEEKTKDIDLEDNINGVSIHIIQGILDQLDQFEAQNKYLSQDITLVKMSKSFKTNSTYLSKVINLKKDKNFSQYLNDLRVDYFMEEVKTNEKFKKFTIKALANECGFKSAESFSKAFYKKHGIYPSYYLNQLENKKK